ncbi:MAG: hypothetical protein JNM72_14575 [Deltaproteobacteria bacterium]|nr:hypothetical protein [Deltaproteobacteria bacterium]
MPSTDVHALELSRLLRFVGGLAGVVLVVYALPGTDALRPWLPGEPVPLLRFVKGEGKVTEDERGLQSHDRTAPMPADTGAPSAGAPEALADAPPEPAAEEPAPPDEAPPEGAAPADPEGAAPPAPAGATRYATPELAADLPPPIDDAEDGLADLNAEPRDTSVGTMRQPGKGKLQDRKPAVGTPLEVPPGALDAWHAALRAADRKEPGAIARALHFGDSTIAADGITKTVRQRLQDRFGDGGPGFVPVHADLRWVQRTNIVRQAKGSWRTRNITHGGAGNAHYGLAGMVSTASGPSSSLLAGSPSGEGKERQVLARFDVFYQLRPDGGSLSLQVPEQAAVDLSSKGEGVRDAFYDLRPEGGARQLVLGTGADGPVTVYGVAMETAGPGVTWETLGVAGAGQGSMMRQGKNHLAQQIARRKPALLVYQMGGNELGYPSLKSGGGSVWLDRYKTIIGRVRAGAPQASCLLITPLDQGERVRGEVRSKPTLNLMIKLQRQTAAEVGCAFWDARAAMGGPGSFGRWLGHKPSLAWADLYHLTGKGLHLVGNTLSDALIAAYEEG